MNDDKYWFRRKVRVRNAKDPSLKRVHLRTTISRESKAWLTYAWEQERLSQGALIDYAIECFRASNECPENLVKLHKK